MRDEPGVLHVYVTSERKRRITFIAERDGISEHDAEKRIKQSDHNRHAFHRRYFKVDAEDALLYDVVINAGRISMPVAVRIVVEAARERSPRPG